MTYEEFKDTLLGQWNDHDEINGWRIVKYSSYFRVYKTIPNSFSGNGMSAEALQDSHTFKTPRMVFKFIN